MTDKIRIQEIILFIEGRLAQANFKLICGSCGRPLDLIKPESRLYRTHDGCNHTLTRDKP